MLDRHICLFVNDLEKELYFYHDLLQCEIIDSGILESDELAVALGLSSCAKFRALRAVVPNSDFMIQIFKCLNTIDDDASNSQTSSFGFHHIGIEVENIDAIYNLLTEAGIKTISEPVVIMQSGTKLFFALDPDGNRIEFFQLSKDQDKII